VQPTTKTPLRRYGKSDKETQANCNPRAAPGGWSKPVVIETQRGPGGYQVTWRSRAACHRGCTVGRFVSVTRASFLAALVALVLAGAAPGSHLEAGPTARVGAIYFDGWACPLSNFHFKGLLSGQFAAREPLNGWRDNSVESMRTQLTWAHQDGIGFFLFDWYRENADPCLNVALQNYKSLGDHHGVGFALLLVHNDVFAISPQEWP